MKNHTERLDVFRRSSRLIKRCRILTILAVGMGTFFPGCTMPPSSGSPMDSFGTASRDTGPRNYLEKGPTLGVEEVRGDTGPTPLEQLELATLELSNAREEMNNLHQTLRSVQRERDDLRTEYTRLNTLYSDLKRTQEVSQAAQQEIMEKVLTLKLEKVRLEKEMLQLKLENLVTDAK